MGFMYIRMTTATVDCEWVDVGLGSILVCLVCDQYQLVVIIIPDTDFLKSLTCGILLFILYLSDL